MIHFESIMAQKTIPQLSYPIGLGLASLGRPGYINLGHKDDLNHDYDIEKMRQQSFAVLDAAYAAGLRHFDTAPSYGQGEAFLGAWLKERAIPKDDLLISSKWGYTYTANWQIQAEKHEIKEHSLNVLQRQWLESQEILGDYLTLYQIHSATLDSGVLENKEVLDQLARYKDQGIKIGLSTSGTGQSETIEKGLELTHNSLPLFDSIQSTYNIFERSVASSLQQASDAGLFVIIKEAVANGRLTPRGIEGRDKNAELSQLANSLDTSIDALALAFIIQQPWVDSVLSGVATIDHLSSNLNALNLKLSSEQLAELEGFIEEKESYWQTRSSLAWN